MLKIKLIGIGAAGNKAAITAFEKGVVAEDELLLINSNLGDIPQEYKKYGAVLSEKVAGTGKERSIAREIAIEYLDSADNIIDDFVSDADLVCIVNSSEGGTGSGASSVLYKYLLNVSSKSVMGFVFTGFEEDSRGLKNTLEFFKDIDPEIAVQVISNKKFLPLLGKNKLKAERLANDEFVQRLRIISGHEMHESAQNIDKTDLLKLVTTPGFMQVEHMVLKPEPASTEQMNQLIDDMLNNSKSLKTSPTCKRLGAVVSVADNFKEMVDYGFEELIKKYGTPYELFTHVQDATKYGNELYVIAAGIEMPLDAVKDVYDKFEAKVQQVATGDNGFADAVKGMVDDKADGMFDLRRKEQATQEELLERKKKFSEMFSK